jgi:arginase
MSVLVPYHLDERVPGLAAELPRGRAFSEVAVELPPGEAGWDRLAPLYRGVAAAVAAEVASGAEPAVVVSGCCGVSLGVLAGVQRAGVDAGVVWFDAHGDVQTMETSTSGYLGGMPLRIMAGYRPELIAEAIDLRAVPEDRLTLVDARDLDPPEREYLAGAGIVRSTVENVAAPAGPVVLHVDLDVVEPVDVPGIRFPVPGGPSAAAVVAAVHRIMATGRVVAFDLACTWDPSVPDPDGRRTRLVAALVNP